MEANKLREGWEKHLEFLRDKNVYCPFYPSVKIFAGGCVERGLGSAFRATAHAHNLDKNFGWICFRSLKRLGRWKLRGDLIVITEPSIALIHEVAHILTPGRGHDYRWKKEFARLLEVKVKDIPPYFRGLREFEDGLQRNSGGLK